MLRWETYAPLVAALSLISYPIGADRPPKESVAASATARAFIDTETGEVRAPTQAETKEMAKQFRRRYIDLSIDKPVRHHEDGSRSKELGTRYRMYSVARISIDGEMETLCLTAEQAADFLSNEAKAEHQGGQSE
ncbi:MAG: hypothetical protein OER80_09100 [Gammaproteobacteria bacterium]|nr:hypothetical protein [Gammaproteobacteria bacterium]MDH3766865.1 hypothetical protein [Gammaproteobacteria bacterium]